MTTQNPYVAPRSAVADSQEEFQPVRVLAVSGRIGRARYIAYSLGLSMLIMIVAGGLGAFMGDLGAILNLLGWAAVVVISIMLSVQRCHDFNTTGWLSILALIPLVNLIFWFIPGTDGPNRFGAPTPPNSIPVLIVVWIFPVLFFTGIIAAVSIPAYQDYVKRSQQR